MNYFDKARMMFAAAIALALAPMGGPVTAAATAGRYNGAFRPESRSGTRKVAWDKRDARKRRNVLRERARA